MSLPSSCANRRSSRSSSTSAPTAQRRLAPSRGVSFGGLRPGRGEELLTSAASLVVSRLLHRE
jgi:hypothetical protein